MLAPNNKRTWHEKQYKHWKNTIRRQKSGGKKRDATGSASCCVGVGTVSCGVGISTSGFGVVAGAAGVNMCIEIVGVGIGAANYGMLMVSLVVVCVLALVVVISVSRGTEYGGIDGAAANVGGDSGAACSSVR